MLFATKCHEKWKKCNALYCQLFWEIILVKKYYAATIICWETFKNLVTSRYTSRYTLQTFLAALYCIYCIYWQLHVAFFFNKWYWFQRKLLTKLMMFHYPQNIKEITFFQNGNKYHNLLFTSTILRAVSVSTVLVLIF